ncbi:putative ribonuclease H protein [Cardamine amara subsp. amara]|uniref:Ribonuclease H protein n=1 Tax=Cardamine amara subsp. amara TaxID=228776 RepID=A0ABD1C2Y6_CARAN
MLIFFDGSDHSLRGILSVLDDFFRMSGLGINLLKSTLFLDGNDPVILHDMATRFGLSEGSFPVKYLGVPLLPNKMRAQDFQPLIDRLNSRFTSWTNRHLSFAGRLQLIQSVIYSVINFWASIFMLPNSCLLNIEKLCNAFLWSGSTLSAKNAKISWDSVCTPKSSGGLSLRRLAKWNNVLGLKLIWLIFTKAGSLWVSWVRTHLIGSQSFWDITSSYLHGSWMWRRLLKLRHIARSFLFRRIGMGNTCSFGGITGQVGVPLFSRSANNTPVSPAFQSMPLFLEQFSMVIG